MRRLVGNDKVPPGMVPALRRLKAIRQGLYLRGRSWWPELQGLSREDETLVRRIVTETLVWQAALPRYTVDGRRIA